MKMKNPKNSIALLLAAAMLVLAGCPTEPSDEETKSGAASVTTISVAGISAAVPEPVSGAVWAGADFSFFDLEAAQVGQVVIGLSAALTDAQIDVAASAGAQVKYASADFDVPREFQAGNTLTLIGNGYLCIQVTSEDGRAVNYYVVEIKLANALTSLTSVTLAGIQADLGMPNAAWNQAAAGSVSLSSATQNGPAIVVTKSNVAQTVKYAKVTGEGEPSFDTGSTFDFADGDFLYIEVTAENGINKNVYKLEIHVGRDTTLSALSIGGVPVINLGSPAATLNEAVAGTVLFNTLQPVGGYPVVITPTDSGAAVSWAAVSTDTGTAVFGTTSPVVFTDQGYLYVKVVAANTTTTAYYKIQVNLMRTGTIKYGQPEIKASSDQFIDPIWASVQDTYTIAKVFQTDSSAAYIAAPTTTGVAKALFDASGLYVYVAVTDPAVDTTGGSDHTKDSVELFINEAVDDSGDLIKIPATYADKGGQYRVNAAGAISGDPAAAASAVSPSKVSAWTTETGYVVIFQAPWRFADQYPLAQNKKIGFELQINACSGGGRDGVMVWNNIAHTNYQNVSDYGEASLDLDGNILAVNAKVPVISTHPLGAVYTDTSGQAAPLTVSAASQDGGTLSYQWYSNTVNAYSGGAPIDGQTSDSYTPNISADGTTYYWVVVTNTINDNSDGGIKTATASSGIAGIVVSSVPLVEKIVAGGSSVPAYRFTPPEGKTWSDYKNFTFTVMVADQTSYDESVTRAHIVGNFSATNFNANGQYSKMSDWGSDRFVIISNGAAFNSLLGGAALYEWKVLSYPITLDGGHSTALTPADESAGPFIFGLGFTVNPNTAAERTVTYYIKDVALVEGDGTKLFADALATPFNSTTLGQLKCVYSNAVGAVVNRTLEPEPEAPSGE
jgi:hypothetical protein